MVRQIKIELRDIPEDARFCIFDDDDPKPGVKVKIWEISAGDSDLAFDLPDDWTTPKARLRTKNYYSPTDIFDVSHDIIQMSGGDFYIDVSKNTEEHRINQNEIESLIHGIAASQNLSERQRFYVSLASLQSYLEYLVYGMLVLSGNKSETEYNSLNTHRNKSLEAFAQSNTDFRQPTVTIAPGKSVEHPIYRAHLAEQETIFSNVRTMRNRVLHSWFHPRITRDKITRYLAKCGEVLGAHWPEEEFYKQATQSLIRLYAKARNTIGGKILVFEEKRTVEDERKARGF